MNLIPAAILTLLVSTVATGTMTAERFATDAATADMAEIALSRVALERSHDQQVKTFAQTIITDHDKADAELRALAAQEHMVLPTHVSAQERAFADGLRGLNGAAFDRAYAAHMVVAHDEAISRFRTAADDAALPAGLRDFARSTLPTLEHHFETAKALDRQIRAARDSRIGSGSGTSGGSGTGAGSATHSGAGTGAGGAGEGNTGTAGVAAPGGTGNGPGTGTGATE